MYVKLFGTILQSSIWSEDPATRLVWITLLTLADGEGYVRSSTSGLARTANVPIKDTERALVILESPDKESGTQEFDGKRIEAVEGGWFLLNYMKYREIRTREQLANAARQKRYRERNAITSNAGNAEVTTITTIASASGSGEGKKGREKKEYQKEFGESFWSNYPKRAGNNPRTAACDLYVRRRESGVEASALLDGVKRYAAYCVASGNIGTSYVLMAQTWLGDKTEGWTQEWTAPKRKLTKDDIEEIAREAAKI